MTLTQTVLANFPPEQVAKIGQTIPLGATPAPEDLAHALLFLASSEVRRITGQILSVDAGQHLGAA